MKAAGSLRPRRLNPFPEIKIANLKEQQASRRKASPGIVLRISRAADQVSHNDGSGDLAVESIRCLGKNLRTVFAQCRIIAGRPTILRDPRDRLFPH